MTDSRFDAQSAFGFLTSQVAYIETQVYEIQYPSIRYPELVPVDTSAGEWSPSVTFFSMDGTGQADWFSGRAMDVNRVEVVRSKYESSIAMAAIGYGYDTEEVAQAMMLGRSITTDKASVARRVAEEFIDKTALFGDASKGFKGLINNSTVTATTAAATGTASATTFASKTPANILADINAPLLAPYTASSGIEAPDTVLLPLTQFAYLATTPFNQYSEKTILQYIKEANVYTAATGRPLTIKGVYGLETAGSGSTARMVVYRRSPDVVKMHMPMPFRFLPLWRTGPMRFDVPGVFRLGGVDIRRPAAFRYVDGV